MAFRGDSGTPKATSQFRTYVGANHKELSPAAQREYERPGTWAASSGPSAVSSGSDFTTTAERLCTHARKNVLQDTEEKVRKPEA